MDKHAALLSKGSKKPKFFYGYVVVVAGFFVMAILNAGLHSFGVFLKPISAEFDWTRAATSGAHSMSLFLMGLLYMVTGRLSDRFGPRVVVTVCGFLFGLGYLLMSQISALWQLYLFYGVIVAMGISGGFVPLVSMAVRWFVRRRALMTGIVASGIGAGTMIGPPLAGWLISNYGWRNAYFMIGITSLVLLVLVAQFLKRDPGQIGQLPYGASPYDGSGVKQEVSVSEASGFSRKEAIRTRQFWMLCMAYLSFGISQMAIMVHIVPHATDLGISVIVAANILTVIGALGLFGRITMGGVADRIGNKTASIIGFALLPVALFWLQFAGEPWMFYLFAVIFGLGVAGVGGLIPPVVAELFGMRAHGSILGMVVFAWGAGGAVGPIVAGYIFDTANSYYLAFMVFAILSIVSLVLTLFLKPPHREDSS